MRQDLKGKDLLAKANLDTDRLFQLGRKIAGVLGLPETTQFCDFHPVKLFITCAIYRLVLFIDLRPRSFATFTR